ncbi:hypothetical protein ACQPZA_15340 [Pseudonocardia xinjiangensis]|uniref:hypothetical protein n=1 Tax=Pseudonocardia xinjiangensis TaxID=75289 RepID=UPI003D927D6E
MNQARPGIDPQLHAVLADMPLMSQLSPEMVAQLRQAPSTPVETFLEGRAVDRREVTVPSPDGERIPLSIFSPAGAERSPAAGGQAELHVWAGGFHAFDALYPQVPVSAAARRTRTDRLTRVLSPASEAPSPDLPDQALQPTG